MENDRKLQQRRDAIGQYITLRNVGTDNESLFIRFDELAMDLMRVPQLKFSVSAFEHHLIKEVNDKVMNRPMTQESFNRLCDYVWDLALFCTSERNKDEKQTTGILEDRARRKREGRIRK